MSGDAKAAAAAPNAAAAAAAPAPGPAPERSKAFGVLFGLYVVITPFVAVLFLMLPALVLLVPGLPAPALRVSLYRRWIGAIMTAWLRLPVALLELFGAAGRPLKIVLSGAYRPPPMATTGPGSAESFVAIANHPSRIDWLVLWSWWARDGSLEHQKIALKRGLAMIPGSGWAMQCASFLFLRRSWADDQQYMNEWIDTFFGDATAPPCQMLLFPEGTNLTAETRGIDEKFVAKSNGALQSYTHVLHPRTTGFVHLIKQIRAASTRRPALDAVYDITIAYPDGRGWTEVDLVTGAAPAEAHFHFTRYALSDLPEADAALADWCNARFAEKEQRIARFRASVPPAGAVSAAGDIPSGCKFEPDSGCADPKVSPTPTLAYVACLAFWTALVFGAGWGLWCSSALRWYTLIVFVVTFVYCKYQPGIDFLILRWTRVLTGANDKRKDK